MPAAPHPPPPRSAWRWVPSLYFAEGLPYVVVMTLSVVMYKRLGVANGDLALFTSWLYLPWVIKPLWSPWVELTRTKRTWILLMQFVVAVGFMSAAWAVRTHSFFLLTFSAFAALAFASATHDIAADGFYMLGLSPHDQTWWSGLRNTFYRMAMVVGAGLLIMLAGHLETQHGLPLVKVTIQARAGAERALVQEPTRMTGAAQAGELRLVARPSPLVLGLAAPTNTTSLVNRARAWNLLHGFNDEKTLTWGVAGSSWVPRPLREVWSGYVVMPLDNFLSRHFGNNATGTSTGPKTVEGGVGVVFYTLSRPPPAEGEIVVHLTRKATGLERLGLGGGDNGLRLLTGDRFVFTRENWNRPFMAVVQVESAQASAGSAAVSSEMTLIASSGDIPRAWSITLFVLAGLFLCFCAWHWFALPKPVADAVTSNVKRDLGRQSLAVFVEFFRKPGILPALAFILLYRFAEAQSVKMLSPFLLDARGVGGLGLTTSQVGFAYGTVGILALTAGGLLGGFLAARFGLKAMLPIMVCAIHLPNLAFVYLSWAQPGNFGIINTCVAVEQFGYGFGFTAYMLFLLYFADGPHRTAHYAICTGLMALGMMVPGMFSGRLQEVIGYQNFFIWVMLATIPGFLTAFLVKIDPQFGRK